MSQALVNKLLEEALKVANDAYGRRAVDSAPQKVMVSRANLRNGFKEAFSKEHREEFKKDYQTARLEHKLQRK